MVLPPFGLIRREGLVEGQLVVCAIVIELHITESKEIGLSDLHHLVTANQLGHVRLRVSLLEIVS